MDFSLLTDTIAAHNRVLDPGLILEHLERLGPRYITTYTSLEIARHIEILSRLSSLQPVYTQVERKDSGSTTCLIFSFNYSFAFSFLTGILASMGFNVQSGNIFTYTYRADSGLKRKIIDHFIGRINSYPLHIDWDFELKKRILEVFRQIAERKGRSPELVRKKINRIVADAIRDARTGNRPALLPLRITINNGEESYTRMQIISQDTPFFLYALSNALSIQKISIEQVTIRTDAEKIEDTFYISDKYGQKISGELLLGRIKLSVLLTKQFTHFLGNAPDSYAALSRFETLIVDILKLPQQGQWMELMSNPHLLQNLARLLGASDFIWEDFVRLQYENLLPMFTSHLQGQHFSQPAQTISARLAAVLESTESIQEKKLLLNQFKDREIYLIDLDHILTPARDFRSMSEHLTVLAENVIETAQRIAYDDLSARHGYPRTVAGLIARHAIFGLGKLGGMALGYASDIELLFVFSDNGRTDGSIPLDNSDFFSKLLKMILTLIETKREGIFRIDLRLRPYGKNGPLVCSLESFCRYYGKDGQAHALERLALVRLRALCGDSEFGRMIENLRDELIYTTPGSIDLQQLRAIRQKQFDLLPHQKGYNAKYSPGALADLEYDVQILQIIHGQQLPELRTPRIHLALEGLAAAQVLDTEEKDHLQNAYFFFRRLINGLRMLRGTAQDLFLPAPEDDEFLHLARRIGYVKTGDLTPGQQLYVDFEANLATVRIFVEKHFGRETLPGPVIGNLADLILSENPPQELKEKILGATGFKMITRAYHNLRDMAGQGDQRGDFINLILLAGQMIQSKPDPDLALNNWERFARAEQNVAKHYTTLLRQPKRLDLLLDLFSSSPYLSNILICNPHFFDAVTSYTQLGLRENTDELAGELDSISLICRSEEDWLNRIRMIKQREMLRIGIRDICLRAPLTEIVKELSQLADLLIQQCLTRIWSKLRQELPSHLKETEMPFCILAFGKLGGNELNYSSDIDLLGVYSEESPPIKPTDGSLTIHEIASKALELLTRNLSRYTDAGYVYRVDLRLRPFGSSGRLAGSIRDMVIYYTKAASLWEIQALLKLRPAAGNLAVGNLLLQELRPLINRPHSPEKIWATISRMRNTKISQNKLRILGGLDLKDGIGGIRDIEFLVQGLQLTHLARYPDLLLSNTLCALKTLQSHGLLSADATAGLKQHYIALRRIEHYLQIFDDQQTHQLPASPADLLALAKKMLGPAASVDELLKFIKETMQQVRAQYLALSGAEVTGV